MEYESIRWAVLIYKGMALQSRAFHIARLADRKRVNPSFECLLPIRYFILNIFFEVISFKSNAYYDPEHTKFLYQRVGILSM